MNKFLPAFALNKLVFVLLICAVPTFKMFSQNCSAKVSATETRVFMCHNLGSANTSADPFTPSWEINGGYWQWGRLAQAAAGPTGPGSGQANGSAIAGWNTTNASNGAWADATKTANDPCPAGFKIPARVQWEGIVSNNTKTNIGAFTNSQTNYTSGVKFGNNLFLPTSGDRVYTSGTLVSRGSNGGYWSSTEVGSTLASTFSFSDFYAGIYTYNRPSGFSVRCISQSSIIGSIGSINCSNATISGTLTSNQVAAGVSASVPYTGGNSGAHSGQTITSSGVTGLTATLSAGTFANGSGSLVYNITGTPGSAGTASFALNIGGKTCTLSVNVNSGGNSGSQCSAKISATETRVFMCHNLGAANTAADPFTPSWEINGGYWQWGRLAQAAAGPTGPGASQANDGLISGWNTTPASSGAWSDASKTANDPCPTGFRVPTRTQLEGLVSNNTIINVGTWVNGPSNYNSGIKFGNNLFLPAAGWRSSISGELVGRNSSGYYWSSTENGSPTVVSLEVATLGTSIFPNDNAIFGNSVRCISQSSMSGSIGSINCTSPTITGTLTANQAASGVSATVTYSGGNGGSHNGQTVTSTGVTGLTATLSAGTFANGSGSLVYNITGTPGSAGMASFGLNIGGSTCTLSVNVNSAGGSGTQCSAKVSATETRVFMCHNLGAANTAADPFTPSWEINGGYWQWGRLAQAAAGPTGPGPNDSNAEWNVSGWSTTSAPNDSWVENVTTSNVPCPAGFQIPTKSQWNGITANNIQVSIGTWTESPTNYSSGKKFGNNLFLPAAGGRFIGNGGLYNRGSYGGYWSSSEEGLINAWSLSFGNNNTQQISINRGYGLSVRCISQITLIGSISGINCLESDISSGFFIANQAGSAATVNIPYYGGNGGAHSGQSVVSTGVTGLTATLVAGAFANGDSTLQYIITGTPGSAGTATFALNIGGKTCTLSLVVKNSSSNLCSAKVSASETRVFMCHNLGANTAADPFTPSLEINGEYWQWGRKYAAASGPMGPGAGQAGDGPIPGWNTVNAANGAWSDASKTDEDPCPYGFRIPTSVQWDGVVNNNTKTRVGTWSNSPINYSSGMKFGNSLFLPSAGSRSFIDGSLLNRGEYGRYLSSTEWGSEGHRGMYFNSEQSAGFMGLTRTSAYSVRCISESPLIGSIGSINCTSASFPYGLRTNYNYEGWVEVTYTGGNGGAHSGQTVTSTGVTGLLAKLEAGTFQIGDGALYYRITGVPSSAGTASFPLNIGGKTCILNVTVVSNSGAPCSARLSASDIRIFMCHNLGSANIAADPFTPSWEINGGYWQWGRQNQAASGPTGPGVSQANDGAVSGWNVTIAPSGSWSNSDNNPCPNGFSIPTITEWEAVTNHSSKYVYGSWLSSPTNYDSGIKLGDNLFLPLAGVRSGSTGSLINRGLTGNYWSRSEYEDYDYSYYLRIYKDNSSNPQTQTAYGTPRTNGLSVRCIANGSGIGSIYGLYCDDITIIGTLIANQAASGVSAEVNYAHGNQGAHSGQIVKSTGVTGLTATLEAGYFGDVFGGNLTYNITGTPASAGIAFFALNIGGSTCTISINVSGSSGNLCSAKVSATETRVFMCHNLGSANTAAEPFTPSWEINGGYWQWGRLNQAAPGPIGSGLGLANEGSVAGWNSANPANGSWSDNTKTANDPCPTGFRVPTKAQWEGVVANNTANFTGFSWYSTATNYNAGIKLGDNLFLPAAGQRKNSDGSLIYRDYAGDYLSSTEDGTTNAGLLSFWNNGTNGAVYTSNTNRAYGCSVRCISESTAIGSIGSINCASTTINGTVIANQLASGVFASVPYSGGNGGAHASQTVTSTGVTGLTAFLQLGVLANGNGTLLYNIKGTPNSAGTANFMLSVGGKTCTLSIPVKSSSGKLCTAMISPTESRVFMCHNLGAASTAAEPFTPSWEINGGYWQWGRLSQAAPGPTGPGVNQTNEGPVSGWNLTPASNGAWSDNSKTASDPCPAGFRVPTVSQWLGVANNNNRVIIGSWTESSINYGSGIKFGNNLFLPAAGFRGSDISSLESRGFSGGYWSSTEYDTEEATFIAINNDSYNNKVSPQSTNRTTGFSVRCISESSVVGSIGSFNCSGATITGTLTANQVTSGVSASVPYSGGNSGAHSGQTILSTGVSGLTATLTAGTLGSGNGNLTYIITGTPASAGLASFALNIGGITCTLVINVSGISGSIGSINCSSPTITGTLTANQAASAVSATVTYTGGNGGSHNGQSVTSTGVTGLTATLAAGTFANGNGSLVYAITGTPGSAGSASFALNIGGKTCTLVVPVQAPSGNGFTFDIDDNICGAPGSTVQVPIRVRGFSNMLSFDVSVTVANPAIAQFTTIQSNLLQGTVQNAVVNASSAYLTWYNPNPVTLPDNTIIGTLGVTLTGNTASSSNILLGNTPVNATASQLLGGVPTSIIPILQNGSVCISSSISIAGKITREDNVGIGNVTVQVTGPGTSQTTVTNSQGNYSFNSLGSGGNYTITPLKNLNHKNGLSGLDYVLISRHYLGIAPLNSPYKIIAADASNDKSINGFDCVLLQRVQLGLDPNLTLNTSWRFVDKSFVFNNPNVPWTPDYPQTRIYQSLSGNITNADFTGIKIGDMNLDNDPASVNLWIDDRNPQSITLQVPEKVKVTNGIVQIPVSVDEDFDLQGIQLTLDFNQELFELVAVTPADVITGFGESNLNLNRKNEGLAALVWVVPDGSVIKLAEGQKIFELLMKVRDEMSEWIQLRDNIQLSDEITSPAAVGNNLNEYNLNWETVYSVKNNTDSFRFAPNPFNSSSTLYMDLKDATNVRLKLIDGEGRILFDESKWVEKGKHSWILSSLNFSSSRVIFYQIQTDFEVSSGRLVKAN